LHHSNIKASKSFIVGINELLAAFGFKGTKRSAPKKSRTQRKRGRKKAVETGKVKIIN